MKNHLEHILFLMTSTLIALIFYSLSRGVFFCFTSDLFPMIYEDGWLQVFLHGIRFDLSAFAYFNIIFILLLVLPTRLREKKAYQKTLQSLFVFFNGLVLFLNLADVVNVEFTGKRMTADIFAFLSQGNDMQRLVLDFIKDYWFIPLIWLLMVVGMKQTYGFFQRRQFFLHRSKINWTCSLVSLLVLGLTVLAMRGGTQLRPIKNIHASYHGQGRYVPLILNAPFSLISTLKEEGLEEKQYFEKEEGLLYFHAEKKFSGDTANKKNVVVIILESLSKEYVGFYHEGKGYTPFLDSLMQHSTVCEKAYANGKRSIEGIPAILSGIPALTHKPYILSQYGTQPVNSIASVLSKESYDCSFYHGGNPGTMGFDAYAKMAEFHSYIDLENYPGDPNDYDGKWGIFDEPFFQFYKTELDAKQEPFFSSIFSLSAHHPYTIPEKHLGKFPKGEIPIHETIAYTDFALKRFFEEAKKSSWFDNTIFVITADHTFTATRKEYQNSDGLYAIPLVFHEPSNPKDTLIEKVCQQADILPTVIDMLDINANIISFGNSIWEEQGFAVNYLNPLYQYREENYLLLFNGEESIALYDLSADSTMTENIISNSPEVQQKMENTLKALVQDYNHRMIYNELDFER